MANELHDNVKFGKQQTINFHENWQHQIDGSQQYLKGHTHTHTYGQWADGKQTNPVEDKDNKKRKLKRQREHRVSGKIMIGYIIQQEQTTTRAGSRANRIERRTIWVTCQHRAAKSERKMPIAAKKLIFIYIHFYQQRQYNIVKVYCIYQCMKRMHILLFFFFFWPRTLGSRETLRVISSVQLRNFPKRSESQTSVLYETHALNVWLLVLPATRMQITVGQLNRKPKSSSRAKLLLVSFRLICYLQHFACQI